ncbi:MAG: fumarate reductase subunit C [Acidobacteriota bacterium]|nr:fumarate reductase subunit C [Acidobacteriota bacterium]
MAKEYIRPMGAGWWLRRPTYVYFMLRELTCVAVGGYTLFLLLLVSSARSEDAFAALIDRLSSPTSVVLHLIALALCLFHTLTWFNVMPQAIVLYRGEDKIGAPAIVTAAWIAWVAVTGALTWIVLG